MNCGQYRKASLIIPMILIRRNTKIRVIEPVFGRFCGQTPTQVFRYAVLRLFGPSYRCLFFIFILLLYMQISKTSFKKRRTVFALTLILSVFSLCSTAQPVLVKKANH